MKDKIFVMLGGLTDFIEYYVRAVNSYGIKIMLLDTNEEKYKELLYFKNLGGDHFSTLVDEFVLIPEKSDFLESIFLS